MVMPAAGTYTDRAECRASAQPSGWHPAPYAWYPGRWSTCKCSFLVTWNLLHLGHSDSILWLYLVNTPKVVSKGSALGYIFGYKVEFCPAISSMAVSKLLRVSGNPATQRRPVINAYFTQIIYAYYTILWIDNNPILLLTKESDF